MRILLDRPACFGALALLVASAAAAPPPAWSATWVVDPGGGGDATTIQGGIDLCSNGDTIEVMPGVYPEAPVVDSKGIALVSTAGSASTHIDGTVRIQGFVPGPLSIAGFELGGGVEHYATDQIGQLSVDSCVFGGALVVISPRAANLEGCTFAGLDEGVRGYGCYLDFLDCVFENNTVAVNLAAGPSFATFVSCELTGNGTALRSYWAWNPTGDGKSGSSFIACTIENNGTVLDAPSSLAPGATYSCEAPGPAGRGAETYGYNQYEDCTLTGNGEVFVLAYVAAFPTRCRIEDNQVLASASPGGLVFDECIVAGNGTGIDVDQGSARLISTTYVLNGGGVHVHGGDDLAPATFRLENSILALNTTIAPTVPEATASLIVEVSCSDVWGNTGGDAIPPSADGGQNFSQDPLFCDLQGGEFGLQAGSPCLPATTGCGLVGALGEACGPVSIDEMSWGAVKGKYRRP